MDIQTELGYIGVLCTTLICWDLMDIYIERKRLDFLLTTPFFIYYSIRAFFSIGIMEILFVLNLFSISNKFIIAFITPLLFPLILQNLIVGVGGKEINIQDIFLSFRGTIIDGIESRMATKRVRIQTKLLNSSLTEDNLRQQCRFLAPTHTKFKLLEEILKGKSEEEMRDIYITFITKWGGVAYAKRLINDNKISLKYRRNEIT